MYKRNVVGLLLSVGVLLIACELGQSQQPQIITVEVTRVVSNTQVVTAEVTRIVHETTVVTPI